MFFFMTMGEMLNCVETNDVFFDSVDHLTVEDLTDGGVGNAFWRNELRSVKERRAAFLHKMGLIEHGHSSESDDLASLEMGLERMVERSGAVSTSWASSCIDCAAESNELFHGRECDESANLVVDDWEHEHQIGQSTNVCKVVAEPSPSKAHNEECRVVDSGNKGIGHWWKEIISKRGRIMSRCNYVAKNAELNKFDWTRTKVQVNKKRFKELSALFASQEIQAHKGIIWAMKFSLDGQYLASGGQDGIVRIWRVKSVDSCLERFCDEFSPRNYERTKSGKENKAKVQVVVPDSMFQLEEQPVQEFYGHAGEVLDLAWSNNNYLLSSSTDKTVRLWQVGYDKCLNIYHHTDYVTCVQFNPVDNQCFISGSIDGKVRVWGVPKGRVLDWADAGDAVTALCYQPDGQGLVVGTLRGTCRFYGTKGDMIELTAHILIHSSRNSSTNRITGIKFSPVDSQTVMVMSEDSKLRVFDKMNIICKYRGRPNSGCQMSASFTSNGNHMISIGEDSRIYLWNHEHRCVLLAKHKKSNRSCEHFHAEGVSVAVPWSGTETAPKVSCTKSTEHEVASGMLNSPSFSLRHWFSSRSSATWPEDMLPIFSPPVEHGQEAQQATLPPSWGLVIVTANCNGMIRTFHNYGLPVRV